MTEQSKHRLPVMSALLFTLFLAALDFSIVTTAMPSIAHALRSSTAYVWIGSTYLLTSAAGAPVWGKVSEIWGRKTALLCAIAIFFAGSTTCGASRTVEILVAGRCIQGLAAGGIIVLVNICISDMWNIRCLFLGMTGTVWALSAGVGPVIGGAFAENLSWRWVFWINLPCSSIAFVVLVFTLDIANPRTNFVSGIKTMDWVGSLTISGLTVMILLGLDFGDVVSPWDSPKVLGLLLGGLVLLILFIIWEANGAVEPVMPLRLLRHRVNFTPLLVCFIHGFVNVSSWYFLPLYFQAVLEVSPTRSGVLILPITVLQACVAVGAGIVIHRFGRYRELIWGGMCLMTLGFGMFISLSLSTSVVVIFLFEIIAALGVGSVFQAPLVAYQSVVAKEDLAAATALFGFVRSLSTSVSVVIGGVVFQNGMAAQEQKLSQVLSPKSMQNFSASSAASNVLLVHNLPSYQKTAVKAAYSASLRNMWILYAVVAGFGLSVSAFIDKRTLDDGISVNDAELSERPE